MIVLGNQRELVRVETWEDITTRPGFDGNLNPANQELASIIGQYGFKDRVPCGLSNCHTPHQRGYIVVTKDGHETNIGKDCGKNYFGVDFEELSAKFTRDMREKENREKLWSLLFRLEDVNELVSSIRADEFGADWVHKQLVALFHPKNLPSKILMRLNLLKRTGDSRLVRDREASEEEASNLEQIAGRRLERPHYIQETVGTIAGLDALYLENDLRSLLVVDLEENLKTFAGLDIDSLSYEQLAKWSKWIGTIEATVDRAKSAVDSGRKLLTRQNLIQFSDALDISTDEHRQLESHIRALPKG